MSFRLPLLSLLTPVLALHLGMRADLPALAAALGCHELAHIIAARCMHVQINEISILPFGGSARMENPYTLSPLQLAFTAAAGPAANLLLAVIAAALLQWELLSPRFAGGLIHANLLLMLFNLLPALPLDGGRILHALLQRPLGEERALRIGIWMGRVLAAALLLCAVYLGIYSGKWNLSLMLAAVFILSSERDECAALSRSHAQKLEAALSQSSSPRPARLYHIDAQTSLHRALKLMRPKEDCWFILTEGGRPTGMIDGRSLLKHMLQGCAADTALQALSCLSLPYPAQRELQMQ